MWDDDYDDVTALVVDTGSLHCKAGFAGNDAPRVISPSIVAGFPEAGEPSFDYIFYVGNEAWRNRNIFTNLKVRCPIEHGFIAFWKDMEKVKKFILVGIM